MNLFVLVSDPSGLGEIWNTLFNPTFSGSYIFFGLLLLIAFVYFMLISRVKAGGVVVCGIGLVYLLTMFNPEFKFMYYLAIIASVIILVIGIKNSMR